MPCTIEMLLCIFSKLKQQETSEPIHSIQNSPAKEMEKATEGSINVLDTVETIFTLFPLDMRRFPDGDKYVVSNQPFASSPRSRNGTG